MLVADDTKWSGLSDPHETHCLMVEENGPIKNYLKKKKMPIEILESC